MARFLTQTGHNCGKYAQWTDASKELIGEDGGGGGGGGSENLFTCPYPLKVQ